MHAKIYQPARSVMQSGQSGQSGGVWVFEFDRSERSEPEALMGWPSSSDTARIIRIDFQTKAEAIAYAEKMGVSFDVMDTPHRRLKLRSYADNFAADRRQAWTH